jgi:hypothetical protein
MLNFFGQLRESVAGSTAGVRKINYLPQEVEYNDESDSDSEAGDSPVLMEKLPSVSVEALAQPKNVEAADKPHTVTAEEIKLATMGGEEAAVLMDAFCNRTAVTRVTPTEKELEDVGSKLTAITNRVGHSNHCKALISTKIIYALAEQMKGGLVGHDWQPQLRTLCLLKYFYGKGGIERFMATMVSNESETVLQHLTREATPCREIALHVMQLRKLADNVPQEEGLVVDSDGGISVRKTSGDHGASDQETNAGSSSAVDTCSDQDDHFVNAQDTPAPMPVAAPRRQVVSLGDIHDDFSPLAARSPQSGEGSPQSTVVSLDAAFDLPVNSIDIESSSSAVEALAVQVPPSTDEAAPSVVDVPPPGIDEEVPPSTAETPTYAAPSIVEEVAPGIDEEAPCSSAEEAADEAQETCATEHTAQMPVEPPPSTVEVTKAHPESGDPFSDFEVTSDPFACLSARNPYVASISGAGSIHTNSPKPFDLDSSVSTKRAGSMDSCASAVSTCVSSGSLEVEVVQQKSRKTMPAIRWGVEDELEAPADPFASLAENSLQSL